MTASEGGELPSIEENESSEWIKNMLRPNIHYGMHYTTIADEYEMPVNVNVLPGEH
jgi:hypothetical protein